MVEGVILSGVATSCDKDYFSPYFIVNFSKSKDTSNITSGNFNGITFVFYSKSKILPRNFYLGKIIIYKKFEANLSLKQQYNSKFTTIDGLKSIMR